MKNRKKFEEKLKASLVRCLLLAEEEKFFWLGQITTLPDSLMKDVFDAVEAKNLMMDEYKKEALRHDPDHKLLIELKTKINQIKKGALQLEEKAMNPHAEADLKQQLKNI